ncbi:MAG: hypothetical protein D6683_03995 [Actinomyces sp.]|nr:MAG: hypothetical protein D6683_03995 [Actinomyces sp.]
MTAVYLAAGGVLLAAELIAVFNRRRGDTITELTKRRAVTHALAAGGAAWLLWHFAGADITGLHAAPAADIGAAVIGAAAGWAGHHRRG